MCEQHIRQQVTVHEAIHRISAHRSQRKQPEIALRLVLFLLFHRIIPRSAAVSIAADVYEVILLPEGGGAQGKCATKHSISQFWLSFSGVSRFLLQLYGAVPLWAETRALRSNSPLIRGHRTVFATEPPTMPEKLSQNRDRYVFACIYYRKKNCLSEVFLPVSAIYPEIFSDEITFYFADNVLYYYY